MLKHSDMVNDQWCSKESQQLRYTFKVL